MLNPYKDFSHVNPQREDGNRQIENTVFNALIQACLSGIEYQLVFYIIDKTWGWGKLEDVISMSQFEKTTHKEHHSIIRSISSLESKHVVIVNRSGAGRGRENTYMFNKYWDTWIDPITRHPLVNSVASPPINQTKVSPDHQSASNGVTKPPINGKVSPDHQSASNGATKPPIAPEDIGVTKPPINPLLVAKTPAIGGNQPPVLVSPDHPQKKGKKGTKERVPLKKDKVTSPYGSVGNVFLTDEEVTWLTERFGEEGMKERVENLSLYKGSTGKKYVDDYLTILSWDRRDQRDGRGTSAGRSARPVGSHKPGATRQPSPEEYQRSLENFGKGGADGE